MVKCDLVNVFNILTVWGYQGTYPKPVHMHVCMLILYLRMYLPLYVCLLFNVNHCMSAHLGR